MTDPDIAAVKRRLNISGYDKEIAALARVEADLRRKDEALHRLRQFADGNSEDEGFAWMLGVIDIALAVSPSEPAPQQTEEER